MIKESSRIKGFVGFFKSIKVKLICYFILMTTLPILIIRSTAYNQDRKCRHEYEVANKLNLDTLKKTNKTLYPATFFNHFQICSKIPLTFYQRLYFHINLK